MQNEENLKIIRFGPDSWGLRLDSAITKEISGLSRSRAAQLIRDGCIRLNGKPAKASETIRENDVAEAEIPKARPATAAAQDIDLDIVYQDEYLAVINKPQGMVVHPAAGNADGTLVNALLFHLDGLSGINGETRPGIVHRLDKDTSGLLVVAKNDEAHKSLAKQIKDKAARRIYWAVVEGNVRNDKGTIDAPIGRHPVQRKKMAVTDRGRYAVTHYTVLERFGGFTLIEARLETGRTHQIRVHMAYIGYPVLGDPVYGHKRDAFGLAGQALHAKKLGFCHPGNGQWMEFEVPLPAYFEDLLKKLRQ